MEELTLKEPPKTAKPVHRRPLRTDIYHKCEFDQQYVDRLRRCDPETETHFTSYFGNLLTIKLRSRLRSIELVEDARQETFLRVLRVLRNRGGIQNPERLGAFVNAVCENVLLEFFRAGSAYQQRLRCEREPASPSLSVESELISQERKAFICARLSELSEADQEMLRKVFLEERDKDEICSELGICRNNLRVRVHRILRRFRVAVSVCTVCPVTTICKAVRRVTGDL